MTMRIATKTPYTSPVVGPKPRKPKAPPKPRAKFPETVYAFTDSFSRVLSVVKDPKQVAPGIGGSREIAVYKLVGVKRISTVIEIKDIPNVDKKEEVPAAEAGDNVNVWDLVETVRQAS